MRRQRPLALLAVVASCGGLSACGADEELSTQVPKTSPDLTIPTGTTEAPADDDAATTTQTTATATTQAPAAPQATPAAPPPPPAAPPPPPPATGSPQTGGQTPETGQSTTGGAQAGGNEFESFCAENPGAC